MPTFLEFIKKWGAIGASFLFASTPSALLVLFHKSLAPFIAGVDPTTILNTAALILWFNFVTLAYILLQHPWLKWDEPTGTWVNRRNGLRYCGTCRAKKVIVPLKNEVTGWRCVACHMFRSDPARKAKEESGSKKISVKNYQRIW